VNALPFCIDQLFTVLAVGKRSFRRAPLVVFADGKRLPSMANPSDNPAAIVRINL
jgi:hypothetical protein